MHSQSSVAAEIPLQNDRVSFNSIPPSQLKLLSKASAQDESFETNQLLNSKFGMHAWREREMANQNSNSRLSKNSLLKVSTLD